MKIEYSKENIKIIIAIVVFVGLATAVVVFKLFYPVKSTEFAGTIQRVEGSNIYAAGFFTVPGHLERYYGPLHKKSVRILIGPDTEITKIVRYNLPIEGEEWDHTKFRAESTRGNLNDLRPGMLVKVFSSENIFDKNQFAALKIEYTQDIVSK